MHEWGKEMGEKDDTFGLCRQYLVPFYDEGTQELVMKTRSLTPLEEREELGDRCRIDAVLGNGRGWKPVAATHDLAIVLEKRRRGQGEAYRLRTVGEDTLLDLFHFEDRRKAFSAFIESVRRYEDMVTGPIRVLATQQIEALLALWT